MSDVVGWHQSAEDPTVSRYWDGQQWQGELRWNGSQWATPDGTAAAEHPSDAGAPVVDMTRTAWWIGAAAALSVVGIFLPLASATTLMGRITTSFSDDGGTVVILGSLAALVVWMGWPARFGRELGWGRIVVLVLVALFWTLAVFTNWSDVSAGQEQLAGSGSSVQAGAGLYLYGVAMVSIWVGIAMAAKDRVKPGPVR